MGHTKEKKILLPDEKTLNLYDPGSLHRYWHDKDIPPETFSTRHSGEGSIMIWASIFFQRTIELHVIQGLKPRLITLACWREHPYWQKAYACVVMTGPFGRTRLQCIMPIGKRMFLIANNVILLKHPPWFAVKWLKTMFERDRKEKQSLCQCIIVGETGRSKTDDAIWKKKGPEGYTTGISSGWHKKISSALSRAIRRLVRQDTGRSTNQTKACWREHPYSLKAVACVVMTESFNRTRLQLSTGQRTFCMANKGILLNCPACSPELNSIEMFGVDIKGSV